MLEAYLPSILAASNLYHSIQGASAEVIIVEDAGGDDTKQWLRANYRNEVRLLEHGQNLGFAAACLTGFINAQFPVVLLLNNDVRLKQDCIAPLVEHFRDPRVFAVTGKIFNQKEDTFCNGGKIARFRHGMWSSYENYDLLPNIRADLSLLSFTAIGAFSAFDRTKFLEIGGFEPLAAMVEDVEISYRGWKRGWYIRYEPRSIAYHDASQTMGRRHKRGSLDMLSRRSRILMHWMLLHDTCMFCRHLAAITGRLLISWLLLDWRFYWAILTGLGNLTTILQKRRETRQTMIRSDRELLQLLERFYRTAPIAPRDK